MRREYDRDVIPVFRVHYTIVFHEIIVQQYTYPVADPDRVTRFQEPGQNFQFE